MNLHDVLEYGPICAVNEEFGWLVTVNGSYVNLWCPRGDGEWENVECRSGHPDLYTMTGAQMIERAEECLKDWIDEPEEEEETEEEEIEGASAMWQGDC